MTRGEREYSRVNSASLYLAEDKRVSDAVTSAYVVGAAWGVLGTVLLFAWMQACS